MFLFDRGDPEHIMGISAEFYESILDYDRRAKTPPRGRPWKVPQKVYEDWDALQASMPDESSFGRGKWDYPFSQRLKVLKHIMGMWKDGVIEPTSDCFSGPIIPGRVAEDDKQEYMFWDCRSLEENSIINNPHPDTPVPDKFYLRNEIEKWEKAHPRSCYSFFKVKSEELYWLPELLAGDGFPTLQDPYGRCWRWKKYPKDLTYGESEMHNVLERLRLATGDTGPDGVSFHVRCRVDTFITMHESKREAKSEMPVIGSFFRKRPHGSDIDWARSFLNVDAKFLLKDMNEGWWE